MEALRDWARPAERWYDLLETWDQVSARLQMEQPITVSRCSGLPLLMMLVQTVVIFIMEMCGICLGVPGALLYFFLTLFWLGWLFIHLEQADVLRQRYYDLELSLQHQQQRESSESDSSPPSLFTQEQAEDPHTSFIQEMETI